MPKFYYAPIKDVVLSSYQENSGSDLDVPSDFDKKIILVVEAETEELAKQIRIGVTDIRMWEKI
jgi:hypothetical protein